MSTVPHGALVLVIDGTGGTTFRNRDGSGGLSLEATGDLTPTELEDDGPAGTRPPEQTQSQLDEATFAKQVAQWLYRQAHKGAFEHLVIAADPQTLGQLRPSLHAEVVDRLVKEVPKTLTNSSIPDIERSITA